MSRTVERSEYAPLNPINQKILPAVLDF